MTVTPPGTPEERAQKAEDALRQIFEILCDAEQEQADIAYSKDADYLKMAQKGIVAMDKVQDLILNLHDLNDHEPFVPSWLDTDEEIAKIEAARAARIS